MLAKFLRIGFWRAFFRLGIGGAPGDPIEPGDDGVEVNDDPPADDDPPGDDPPADDDSPGDDAPGDEPPADDPPRRRSASDIIREEKAARKDAEERARRNEEELIALRRRDAPPPRATPEQETFQAEETRLKDPNTTDLEKWQINANRELRANRQYAQGALSRAQDIEDRTLFKEIIRDKPLVAKKYATQVETELGKLRAQGGNATREQVLALLIGRDHIRGDLKPVKKAAAKPAGQDVPRGRTPGVRSDVSGKETKSESAKRRARLEKIYI